VRSASKSTHVDAAAQSPTILQAPTQKYADAVDTICSGYDTHLWIHLKRGHTHFFGAVKVPRFGETHGGHTTQIRIEGHRRVPKLHME
jgi:hypothetical protein